MIEWLNQIDIELFRVLNGLHAPWLDAPNQWLSAKGFWVPGYLLAAALIWRNWGWKELIWFGVITGLAVILADQVASGILKPWIARYRPCRPEADLDFIVHVVDSKCGGKYGFASSHAANFFAMAMMFSARFRQRPWPVVFFFLAFFAAYSRIYLGVHYPGDILVGALIGIGVGGMGRMVFHHKDLKERLRLTTDNNHILS